MRVRAYRDEHGIRRAEADPPCLAVDLFLMDDVQGSSSFCLEILEHIDTVLSGDEPSWETAGNASTLIIRPDGAHIENEYAIPPAACDLSLDDLRVAITTWLEFVESEAKGRGRRADEGNTA